jgi:hypothetical protein
MKNTREPDGLHRDDPNRNSCRPDDFTMSERFDAPLTGECPRKADPHAAEAGGAAANRRNRRRSKRRAFDSVIRVYGNNLNGNAFYEDARTINVSVYGALLKLDVPVSKGQKLLLFNEAMQRQQVCQIVGIRVGDTESPEVAVAFPTPHAEFWHVFSTPDKMRIHSKTNRAEELEATRRTLSNWAIQLA